MPVISVIVPAYNAEGTILETIRSVQQQTFTDFELIVVDDGSRDRTLKVLETIEDERLKVFSYENAGAAIARNRGMVQAKGEFIAFLDADDLWTPDKLEAQLRALQQHPEAGVAYSWTEFVDKDGKFLYAQKPVHFEGNVYAQLLLRNFFVCGSIPLIRKAAIDSVGEFDPALKLAHDRDYWQRLAAQWPFVLVPQYQIQYRQSSSSLSANLDFREKYSLLAVEKSYQAAPIELQPLKKQSLANVYQHVARMYLFHRPTTEGVQQAGQRLGEMLHLYPKMLFKRETQKLLLKWSLMRLLSPQVTNRLLQRFKDRSVQMPGLSVGP
ncbi:glycosyltransferase family A protein [Leptolyngbya sp. FACHB-261]|uniref:glycosyltransferase family 2 protein n=1 Tax=Leptolyngbya sp. FACHB-261 TaxID=2692806 RepID=UPI0016892172|nr:glycosyltransferase family A protein [Leptolyngbya sp. FACHB-261]MBD2103235.1 glycosyltransferase family 2 protein [Leptolyngbya sp. FACHB-261]